MPPQYAVYQNRNARTQQAFPFIVDVQVEFLHELQTRVVIPLIPRSRAEDVTRFPMSYLTPVVTFDAHSYVLMTPQLAGIARAELGPHAGSLAHERRPIATALELLLQGL